MGFHGSIWVSRPITIKGCLSQAFFCPNSRISLGNQENFLKLK